MAKPGREAAMTLPSPLVRPGSPSLRRALAGDLCAGCGLCAGVSQGAVELVTVAPGYSRPLQIAPLPAAAEAKIEAACPGLKVAPWPLAPHRDVHWGPHQAVLTGRATDAAVRHQASSGGAISALAMQALADGLVDAVVHVTADPERPAWNVLKISRNAEEVLDGAGSRYAASSPLASIDSLLAAGLRYAFIGKPCDISALRMLATRDSRVDERIPIMLSFFCGGVPSHAGADRIVRAMGLAPEKLSQFRYRGFGWPGKTVAETSDGGQATMSYAESWGKHLSREVQFRCKICPDAVGGAADIAAADAWYGGDTGYPQFEERDGRSLIMPRTRTGLDLVDRCIGAGRLEAEPLPLREIDLMQPSQANRKRLVSARRAACRTLLQPVPVSDGLMLKDAAREGTWHLRLKNYLGTLRRIITGRR
jgi:coenzyme F420 hydrogenase subunit beta